MTMAAAAPVAGFGPFSHNRSDRGPQSLDIVGFQIVPIFDPLVNIQNSAFDVREYRSLGAHDCVCGKVIEQALGRCEKYGNLIANSLSARPSMTHHRASRGCGLTFSELSNTTDHIE